MKNKNNPYGDDAGTRVGHPSEPKRANKSSSKESTKGAGKSMGSGQEGMRGAAKHQAPGKSGEEPRVASKDQHVSGYGSEKGKPKRSSDQR